MFFLAIGLSSWIILEYVMHRFVLHNEPMNITHEYHHKNPKDKEKIVISPFISIPVSILYCIIAYLIFGLQGMILSFFSFFTGYVIYELIHYYIHYSVCKNPLIKYLRKHHFLHHYKYDNKNFGVTSPICDYIFRTKI